MSLEEYFTSSQ